MLKPKSNESHHPLPKDERARHDRIPESIERGHDMGDDDPDAPMPSLTEPPERSYSDPQKDD
jgi:hypothetical protein